MAMWINTQRMLVFLQLLPVLLSLEFEPKFDKPVVNVTVKEKDTAILPCSVNFLGVHQVVWTDQFSTLLTFEDRRIIDDDRLSVERPYGQSWNLHIRDARYSDQGMYNCQINTNPVKIKTVNLIVLVPAKILDHLSSTDVKVREGESVTLICNVTGTPYPTITWYRHLKDSKVEAKTDKEQVGKNGEILVIYNVTRDCSGLYECLAFNNVPPAAKKLIKVDVEFAPEIVLPNKRIGQIKDRDTILECTVSAFPHAVTLWEKNGEQINSQKDKYTVEVFDEEDSKLTLSLRVFSLDDSDFGEYTCISSNPLGEDRETMVLFDYSIYNKPATTTTTPAPETTRAPSHPFGTSRHQIPERPDYNSNDLDPTLPTYQRRPGTRAEEGMQTGDHISRARHDPPYRAGEDEWEGQPYGPENRIQATQEENDHNGTVGVQIPYNAALIFIWAFQLCLLRITGL